MIEEKELVKIGKFQKTHALKGELNAIIDIDSDYVENGEPLIVNMDGIFVPFYAESIRGKGVMSFLIKLEEVDSEEDAKLFVNHDIYALKETLREYYEDEDGEFTFEDELVGYQAVDEKAGVLGEVTGIDDNTSNVLLIVENEEGDELYIPLAEDFILAIDNDERKIIMSLPDGLLDINKKENKDD